MAAGLLGAAILGLAACSDGPLTPSSRLAPSRPALAIESAPAGALSVAPTAPLATVNTTYVPSTGRVVLVEPTQSLQAAIDTARPGDVITLRAGQTYTGNFVLKPKSASSAWITIRTSTPDALLPAGTRVSPTQAPLLARVVAPNGSAAIGTVDYASRYRLIGLEVTTAPAVTLSNGIVQLGDNTLAQNTLAEIPSDIILDRAYVHGSTTNAIKRCVALNGKSQAVVDSYVAECHHATQDAQAINGTNGPGPFRIENNYLEASGEVIMFGGADPAIANLVPSDIEVRRNLVTRPVSWKGVWFVKNLFELKNAQRVVVEDNVFENNWAAAQVGFAIVLTPVNDGGTCTWCVVQDVSFTHNVVRRSSSAFNVSATNGGNPTRLAARLRIAENEISQIDTLEFTGGRRIFQLLNGLSDVSIDHNTVETSPHALVFMDGVVPMTRLNVTNNVAPTGNYGIFGSGSQEGTVSLNRYAPGAWVARNVFVGAVASRYPADNYFPSTLSAVGFVDLPGGDYALAPTSPFAGAATDGTDPGALASSAAPAPLPTGTTGAVSNAAGSGCLSVSSKDATVANFLIVSGCVSGAGYQTWTVPATGTQGRITLPSSLCLSAGSGAVGAVVGSATCGSAAAQSWTYSAAGEIRSQTGYCAAALVVSWGTKVVLASCDASASQRWSR